MVEAIHNLHGRCVGEIAVQLPGASGVFRRFGIDFCCHGDVPLAEAASRRNLDLGELETALDALDPTAAPDVRRETAALIDHIQTRYRDLRRQQLPKPIKLSRKVEAVHTAHSKVSERLADTLQKLWCALEVHMKKEELFPAMARRAADRLAIPMSEIRPDDRGAFFGQVARLTDDDTMPEGACRSWEALYAGATQFRVDLMEHIHRENNTLFPRFEKSA